MQKIERNRLDVECAVQGVALHQRIDPKCANPACPVVFHWLIGGKFFRFSDRHCDTCSGKASAESLIEKKCEGHCVKHFWLCDRCSSVFTLTYRQPVGVFLKLLWSELPEAETIAAAHKMVAG
jgi:hypothetical protein